MISQFLFRFVGVCIVLASGWTGAVQASVVYQGRWDPAYGADFPTMGWRAEAQLVVADSCAASIGTFSGTLDASQLLGFSGCAADANGAGGIRLTSLLLGLYALPDGPSTDLYGAGDWIVANDGQCGFACFTSIEFSNGDVVGFQTAVNSLAEANTGTGYLSRADFLNTCSQQPQQIDSRDVAWNLFLGVGGTATSQLAGGYFSECGNTSSENQPVEVTLIKLGQVPEPGSIALAAIALAGAGFARRRALARRS